MVVALALMGFVAMLLFGMTSLVRVESRRADIQKTELVARQNALLGMRVALGRLQQAAGPDRRVTARADLFGSSGAVSGGVDPEHARWVGVWDSSIAESIDGRREYDQRSRVQRFEEAATWLVSGRAEDRGDPRDSIPSDRRVAIPADGADADPVRVPAESIAASGASQGGAFGYWVDDEGGKARVDLADPYRGSSDATELRRRLAVAQRTGPEAVLPAFPAGSPSVARAEDLGDFEFGDAAVQVSPEHFTTRSAGVLASTLFGGLRKDLTLALRPDDFADVPPEFRADPERFADPGRYLYYVPTDRMLAEADGAGRADPRMEIPGQGQADGDLRGARWEQAHDFFHLGERLGLSGFEAVESRFAEAPAGDGRPGRSVRNIIRGRSGGMARLQLDELPLHELQAFGDAMPSRNIPIFDRYEPSEKDLARAPLAPALTEIRFYISVGFDDNSHPVVRWHPYVELTNPYNVPVRPQDHVVNFGRFTPLLDFQFTDTDPDPWDTIQWSDEGWTGDGPTRPIEPRYFGAMTTASSEYRDEGEEVAFGSSNQARAQSIGVSIPESEAGTFAPGETKSFVLGETIDADAYVRQPEMEAGDDWQADFWEAAVRPFQLGFEDDDFAAIYELNELWPANPNDFERMSISVTMAPFYQAVTNDPDQRRLLETIMAPRYFEVEDADQFLTPALGTVSAAHMSMGAFPFDLADDSGVGDANPGDALRFEISLGKTSGEAWRDRYNVAGQSPVLILQMTRESADEAGGGGADAPSAENVFGQTNMRSFVLEDGAGLPGAENFAPEGWRFRFFENPNNGELQDQAWGKSNAPANDERAVLFDVPRETDAMASIGRFRHANFGIHAGEPAYLVGNGRRPRTALSPDRLHGMFNYPAFESEVDGTIDFSQTIDAEFEFWRTDVAVDTGFYLNRALWDRYFFSTKPAGWTPSGDGGTTWANARMRRLAASSPEERAAFDAHDRIASQLLVEGAFNVNSTSHKAWAAVLASLAGVRFPGGQPLELAYPRTLYPAGGKGDLWSGYREYALDDIYVDGQETDGAVDSLSEAVVQEVKRRGPFLSLEHFVNRQLVADSSAMRGRMGTLAAAIERSGINDGAGEDTVPESPGALSQHDLLEPLGPSLAARSDTFTVRAVGRARTAANGAEATRAVCEAVVQRMPAYVDPADAPRTPLQALSSAVNRTHGRAYRVVRFRWIEEGGS